MDLNVYCFILFGVLFSGFLMLEGFGYGVGMLLPLLGKTEVERQAVITTLAPVWEGNQVWLITAGAVLFAAFPSVYATLLSGLYLVFFVLLTSLIVRGLAFEFRDKGASRTWRNFWDLSLFAGSLLPALLWGVAMAGLSQGLPVDAAMQYNGSLMDLITPDSLAGGVCFVFVFLLHGAAYLTMKLQNGLARRARRAGIRLGRLALLSVLVFAVLTYIGTDLTSQPAAGALLLAVAVAVWLASLNLQRQRCGESFIFSSLSVLSLAGAIFAGLFPRIIISSHDPRWNLDIYNAAADPVTLKLLSVTASFVLPVLLAFESWKYYIFKKRIDTGAIELAAYEKRLRPMQQELDHLLQVAYDFTDGLDKLIRAFRGENGRSGKPGNGRRTGPAGKVCRRQDQAIEDRSDHERNE